MELPARANRDASPERIAWDRRVFSHLLDVGVVRTSPVLPCAPEAPREAVRPQIYEHWPRGAPECFGIACGVAVSGSGIGAYAKSLIGRYGTPRTIVAEETGPRARGAHGPLEPKGSNHN